MTTSPPTAPPGFHPGELAVQQQAGVRAAASRLSPMLDPAHLTSGAIRFLASQTLAILSARDHDGLLWTSPLTGPVGFLEATAPSLLHVRAAPLSGDPLHHVDVGQPVGLLVIDFARRRRFRINGWLTATEQRGEAAGLTIHAAQAYGNCPQYIQRRELTPSVTGDIVGTTRGGPTTDLARLDADDIAQIASADTFFLGTTHPTHGGDASHRGGPPGFVRVQDPAHLCWPDYPGNNMFNSFGNLAVDPSAALLFCDFATGRTLHVSGTARVERTSRGGAGNDGGTGRRVTFTVERARIGVPLPLRAAHSPASGPPAPRT